MATCRYCREGFPDREGWHAWKTVCNRCRAVIGRAQRLTKAAVKRGMIKKKMCYFCGAGETLAHHHNYYKPLDPLWLCPRCHNKLHAIIEPDLGFSNGQAS